MTTTATVEETKSLEIVDTSNFTDNIFICNAAFQNFNKICRFCLSFDNVKSIFYMSYEQKSIQSIILNGLSLKVTSEDHLPYNLCVSCVTQLIRCYKFKNRCVKASRILGDVYINRNYREEKEILVQSSHFRCYGVSPNNSINKDMKTDNSLIKAEIGDTPEIHYSHNLIIDLEDSLDTQTVHDIISDNSDSTNVIVKNEDISDKPTKDISSDNLQIKNAKTEDMQSMYNDILEKNSGVSKNFTIKIEEVGITPTVCESIGNNNFNDNIENITIANRRNCLNLMDEKYKSSHSKMVDTLNQRKMLNLEINNSEILSDDYRNIDDQKPNCICKICKKIFKEHSKEEANVCSSCSQISIAQFPTKTGSIPHKQLVTEKESCICSVCQKSFTQQSSLNVHMRIHKGERQHKCNICRKAFTQKSSLNMHMLVHTGVKRHKCNICRKSFIRKCHLDCHILIHTGEKPNHCSVCKKSFAQETFLHAHMRLHAGEQLYNCNDCKKSFANRSSLNVHMRIHTRKGLHKCNVCEKTFTSKTHIDTHMLIHTNEKPYECGTCKKSFFQKSHLNTHMLIHRNERAHKCSTCKKSFVWKYHLNKHMLIHTSKKLHKCDLCERSFTDRSGLNVHMLIHTGQKKHRCSVCTKSFIRKCHLNRHMLIHTGEKPHKCSVCEKSFIQKFNLEKHMLVHASRKTT